MFHGSIDGKKEVIEITILKYHSTIVITL